MIVRPSSKIFVKEMGFQKRSKASAMWRFHYSPGERRKVGWFITPTLVSCRVALVRGAFISESRNIVSKESDLVR